MDIFIICLVCVSVILQIVILIKYNAQKGQSQQKDYTKELDTIRSEVSTGQSSLRQELSAIVQNSIKSFGDIISDNQKNSAELQNKKLEDMDKSIVQKQELMSNSIQAQMKQFEERLKTLESTNEQKLDAMRDTIQVDLKQEINALIQNSINTFGGVVSKNQMETANVQNKKLEDMDKSIVQKQELMSNSIQAQMKQFEERLKTFESTNEQKLDAMRDTIQVDLKQEINTLIHSSIDTFGSVVSKNQMETANVQNKKLEDMDKSIVQKQELMNSSIQAQMKQFEERLKTLESTNEQKLDAMRDTISKRLSYIQEDNNNKLNEIQATVNEKLQKTLEDKMNSSFKLVSERLEQVYTSLGEMQSIAVGVGDLKKVLSNVKTRGILGEIQLGAILSEILTPDQYDTEVPTIPNSSDRVEFAVKLPAKGDGETIYLPIDSKFPGDTFAELQDAYSRGNAEEVQVAYKKLETVIKKSAKDIHDKYIAPPYTTNFGIMFLPFEGLYAEVVNRGLVEVLQRDYNVNIAGPSTMAAMLNSLQMGFKTLQIQKRSNEVWEVLSAVKTEFDNFEKVFDSTKKRIRQLDDDMDKLIGTRTRAIKRKLREVQSAPDSDAKHILGIEDIE